MDPADQPLLLQSPQVAGDGDRRDAKACGQVTIRDNIGLLNRYQDASPVL
jgi:hypothetical protein